MKEVNKIKIKINVYKYRFLIFFVILTIVLLVFIKILPNIQISVDTTSIGIIGTLLGAIVGGIFTLMGSIYVNNKQLTSNFEIKRKNIIYRPLYDELLEIRKILVEENPYPHFVEFDRTTQTMIRHPQFNAWNRIKNDSRILETPKCLKEQYNKLINCIEEYTKIRNSVNESIKNVLNEELSTRFNKTCSISNIGEVISSEILENKRDKHFLKSYIVNPMNHEEKLSDQQIIEVEQAIYERCDNMKKINNVRNIYDNWIKEQENTMELLENLILEIGIKYEKQRS